MIEINTTNMEIKELWEVINDQKIKHQDFVYKYSQEHSELQKELNKLKEQVIHLTKNQAPAPEDDGDSDTGSFITHDNVENNNTNCTIM